MIGCDRARDGINKADSVKLEADRAGRRPAIDPSGSPDGFPIDEIALFDLRHLTLKEKWKRFRLRCGS